MILRLGLVLWGAFVAAVVLWLCYVLIDVGGALGWCVAIAIVAGFANIASKRKSGLEALSVLALIGVTVYFLFVMGGMER